MKTRQTYDLIIFDWDGTLMDSAAAIVASLQGACRDLDLPVPPRHQRYDRGRATHNGQRGNRYS